MKNTALLILTLLFGCISFVACNDDNDVITNEDGMVLKKFKATHPLTFVKGTRTAINTDGKTIVWKAGEQIGIFSGGTRSAYTLSEGAETAAGLFTGYSPEETNGGYYGISPYNDKATISGNKVSGLVVPAIQKATKGTYDPQAAVMTSYTETNTMAFAHVCSFIKVEVGEEEEMKHLMRITVEAMASDKETAGRPLAGTFDATIVTSGDKQSEAEISNINNSSNKVVLEPEVGHELEHGTYYIAVLPGDIDCFVIRFETVQKSLMRRLPVKKSYDRAEVKVLGKFPGDTWTWTEEKKQEVIYSGNYHTTLEYAGGQKRIYFATGNLQAVMSGNSTAPFSKWQLAEHQYDYVGATSGNLKVYNGTAFEKGDIVDLFAWVADKDKDGNTFTTDSLQKYGITKITASSNPGFFYTNDHSASYGNANSCTDWGAIYKKSSKSTRDWKVLPSTEWNNFLDGRTQAHKSTACTVTKEGGGTVKGIWVYPNGSNNWETDGTGVPGTTCSYDEYLSWIAKGCMFFPASGYMTTSNSLLSSGYVFYWSSNAANKSSASSAQQRWMPKVLTNRSGSLNVEEASANQRCCVRLYTESDVE